MLITIELTYFIITLPFVSTYQLRLTFYWVSTSDTLIRNLNHIGTDAVRIKTR